MNISQFSLNIEGDYVDSYIYSGLLFLVDIDYILAVYKWEDIIRNGLNGVRVIDSNSIRKLLNDSRNPIPKISLSQITISKSTLKASELFAYKIGVWPTDISIFASKLYISSENGVSRLTLDYQKGTLSDELVIYNEMSFAVSPNSFGRLAFAAGKEGIFTVVPLAQVNLKSYVNQLLETVCLDLDWQTTKLLAKTNAGVVEANFAKMPRKSNFDTDKEFYECVRQNKKLPPTVSVNDSAQESWIAGDKQYVLNVDGTIGIKNIGNSTYEINSKIVLENIVLKARTAAFGTIIETKNSLIGLIGHEKIQLADEAVCWRVFPRAKNYANQLHIVKDDRIEIMVVASVSDNIFGFDTERISDEL